MRTIRLIAVGKLKQPYYQDAAAHYAESLSRQYKLEESTVKDGPSKLGPVEKSAWEGEKILAALDDRDIPICMDERGKARGSEAFSSWLESLLEDQNRRPCFIVGGAFGLSPAVRRKAMHTISLGPMTLPHELARVVLLEQLYRASTIIAGIPYHHR